MFLDSFSVRNKNILKHISWSFIYRGLSVIISFLIVSLTLEILDEKKYGVWLVISSFISWFSVFDIGLGNGLRNKLTEALAQNNKIYAQSLVSTAYIAVSTISILLLILFSIVNFFIDWSIFFNAGSSLSKDLSILMPLVFIFFCFQLILKLITSIFLANQIHSIQIKIHFFSQFISLIAIWILSKLEFNSLIIVGTILSFFPVLILILINFFAFRKKFIFLKPKISLFNKKYLNETTNLGFKFFIVQIAAMILYTSDNFIITRYLSPEEVVPYNISFKFFSTLTIMFTLIVTPFWSTFTDAYVKNEFDFIKKSIAKVQKTWILVPIILIVMIYFSNDFYVLWLGDKIDVPIHLSILMAIYVLMSSFVMIYVSFLNGVGKIKLQLFTSILSILINIPLSIYFINYLKLGSSGVILATCFCLLYSVVLRPIQCYKIINNTAKGIWNK